LPRRRVPVGWAVLLGVVIGLLSGVVGVGGGIFLSPLLVLLRWADPRETAAGSAVFIVANSISGLLGRLAGGTLGTGVLLVLGAPALLGGWWGSRLGAQRFSGAAIRRLLALALVVAAAKLVLGVL